MFSLQVMMGIDTDLFEQYTYLSNHLATFSNIYFRLLDQQILLKCQIMEIAETKIQKCNDYS